MRKLNGTSVLPRITGMGAAAGIALALLAGGCVLAVTAGPRQAQATAQRALRQTMNGLDTVDQSIVASSNAATINDDLSPAGGQAPNLTAANLSDITTQLRGYFGAAPVTLAPRSADWAGITTGQSAVLGTPPSLKGIPAKIAIAYRYPLAGHMRLVAGTMAPASPPPPSPIAPANAPPPPIELQVVVTEQMARVFALRPGSQVLIAPDPGMLNQPAEIRLDVTGIVEPTDPGASFWNADPLLAGPVETYEGETETWEGDVIADLGELNTIQGLFDGNDLATQWVIPVDTTRLHGLPQALYDRVDQLTNQLAALTGPWAPMAKALTVSSGLLQPLATLVQESNAVNVLLLMVYVGLAVAGIVMLLLAARIVVARRDVELAMLRARGASLWQLFWFTARGAAVTCVPVAALAWVAAVLLVPDAPPAGAAAWWPGIATVAAALAGPGLVAAWQHRLRRRRQPRPRHSKYAGRWANRLVFEGAACAAAIGAITVFRLQAGATDLFVSAAPVLIAVPAVIVVLRLYQVLLRGLARAAARRRGLIGFLGLARAAQQTLTLALPAMTLVLALTVAAFTGMLRDAVAGGETLVSWQETGADVVLTAPGLSSTQSVLSPSAVRSLAAVPGVRHAATALTIPVNTSSDLIPTSSGEVTVIAVDPASYAALVASTQGFSPVNSALLTGSGLTGSAGQGVIPVLASPQAAAFLGGTAGTTIAAQEGLPALRVRVAGELQSTPAMPGGGAFLVLPLSALAGLGNPAPVNLMLLTGPSIDMTRLHAVVRATLPGKAAPAIITRSQALRALTTAPLQRGTFVLFGLALGFAAALALAVLLLELALGTAERELTMARLATMGLSEGQRGRLTALEVLPAVAAAAVAMVACGLILPGLVAPAVDLSVFTGSRAAVPLRPDLASFLVPLGGLLLITVVALVCEVRLVRGRSVAATMRA